jgi:Caspase domain
MDRCDMRERGIMTWRRQARCFVFGAALGLGCLASEASAETHAVVVGINDYLTLKHLKGAEADAQDIYAALKQAGVTDVVPLIGPDATRDKVMGAIDQMIAHAHKDDLAIITFAGHGGQEKWGAVHPPGTNVGALHEVFLLKNVVIPNADGKIDLKLGGSFGDRILGSEIAVKLKRLDELGVRTIFVADTCHGGGMTRQPMFDADDTERFEPNTLSFADGADPLLSAIQKLPAPIDTDKEMRSLSFLAAVDRTHKTPEVDIPKGSGTKRGALSYAFARVVEGKALENGKTELSHGALLSYVTDSISHSMLDSGKGQEPDLRPRDHFDRVAIRFGSDLKMSAAPAPIAQVAPVVKIFSRGDRAVEAVTRPELGFAIQPVSTVGQSDLVYDPSTRDVFSRGGDLIAKNVLPIDLGGVAEREIAIRRLVELASARSRPLKLDHGDKRYLAGDVMSLDARRPEGEAGAPEYYLLVVISGNGKVQFEYPLDNDPKTLPNAPLGQMEAVDPFGADYAVFVSDEKPMDDLIKSVRKLHNLKSPNAVVNLIEKSLSRTMRIGLQGIYTAPKS